MCFLGQCKKKWGNFSIEQEVCPSYTVWDTNKEEESRELGFGEKQKTNRRPFQGNWESVELVSIEEAI